MDTDLFEQIFQRILEDCYRFKQVDPTAVFAAFSFLPLNYNL
ncbi:hypothetical protein [Butyrivibrio sp. FCS014]|nr:hypothetical protein [Butyrivibrio sp. FCS014]